MKGEALKTRARDIVVDEILPHSAEIIWTALTTGELIGRWLMTPTGFEPIEGTQFTFKTSPAGEWDGTIHCRVLEVKPCERLAFSWRGGHEANVGYGSRLNTVVTLTLYPVAGGTRLVLVHSGFVVPTNDAAYATMGEAWPKVLRTLGSIAGKTN